jgi:capsular exopolysaccharide family
MADKTNINMDLLLQELQGGKPDDALRVKEFFYLCLAKWRWFVVSVLSCVCVAAFYILCTPPLYTRSAFLMVKEDTKGKAIGSDVASMFADLGLTQASANVNNELLAMRMPSAIKEVVKRLGLDTDYRVNGFLHKETLYGKELPVKVVLPGLEDAESVSFTIQLLPGGKVELDDFKSSERDLESETVTGTLNDTLQTPLGKIIPVPTPFYSATEEYPLIHLSRTNLYDCVDGCIENLEAELSSEDATVIELSYKDISIPRAEDVLNTVITVYNEEWMKDKNQITVSTSRFISERLEALERELGKVDSDISTYKSENLLPDAEKASMLFMEQAQENDNRLIAISTQAAIAKYIREHLTGGKKRNQLIPANLGLENTDIEGLITEYNTVQLKRNNLITNSSDQNPLIADLDQSLASMRTSIVSSIDNLVMSLDTQRDELLRNERRTTAKIAVNPDQTKYLQTVGRQQKVKEALYLFLLQKREENELSQAFTPYNMRILTPPSGNLEPVAPQKKKILAVAFLLGLMFPAGCILLRENMNTTVRGRKDIARLAVPFIGEIPLDTSGKKKRLLRKQEEDEKRIVVKEGSRNVMNEAFRVLRTNMEFMSGNGTEAILLTSFNPGSGKTFLTMNVAVSLAIKRKKVLVIDGDLRHGSLSSYIGSPGIGLSDYLAKRTDGLEGVIHKVDARYAGLDMIPVGTMPPNPTELLSGEYMRELVTEMRARYDYIFIDCPPVDIVADTQILEKVTDRTFFVVRAGLMERNMLPEVESLYKQKKLKNMAVILNGTENESGRYGYRYGYKYGYRYGYGSGNDKNTN